MSHALFEFGEVAMGGLCPGQLAFGLKGSPLPYGNKTLLIPKRGVDPSLRNVLTRALFDRAAIGLRGRGNDRFLLSLGNQTLGEERFGNLCNG